MRFFKTVVGVLAIGSLAACLVGCGGGEESPRPMVKRSAPGDEDNKNDGAEKPAKP